MMFPQTVRTASVLIGLGLAAACASQPVAGQPTAAPPTPVSPATATALADSAAPLPAPVCGTATKNDNNGGPLTGDYATAAQRILTAACHHDYQALANLMDSPFIYGPNYQSAAPSAVIRTWKASYPSGKNLDALAKAMTTPPAFDQGGYTFTSGGATVGFARLYQSNPWTEFTYGSTAAPVPPVKAAPVQTDCPTAAVLQTVVAKANPTLKLTGVTHVLCSGDWAGAQLNVDDGGTINATSALFKRQGSSWVSVPREGPCAQGVVPASLRVVCDSD